MVSPAMTPIKPAMLPHRELAASFTKPDQQKSP
jgi:hypothetical protein